MAACVMRMTVDDGSYCCHCPFMASQQQSSSQDPPAPGRIGCSFWADCAAVLLPRLLPWPCSSLVGGMSMARGSSATGRSSEFFFITWAPSPFYWTHHQPEQPRHLRRNRQTREMNPESRTDGFRRSLSRQGPAAADFAAASKCK